MRFFKSWKTSLTGVATIAMGAIGIINSGGDMSSVNQSIAAIIAGIGLMSAKDSNVTGGTVASSPGAAARVEREKEK